MPPRDEHGRISFSYTAFMHSDNPTIFIHYDGDNDGDMKVVLNMNDVGDSILRDDGCNTITQEEFDAVFD